MTTKGANWTRKEDEVLCAVYIQVSENSDKGTSQKDSSIWRQVEQNFKESFNGTPPNYRYYESCKARWKKHLYPQMNKWHQCVKRAERRIHSGANQADQQHLAEDLYKENMNGKIFRHQSCYNLCKDTWVTFDDPPQESYGPAPVQRNVSISLEDDEDPNGSTPTQSSTLDSVPRSNPLPRPMGRNTARRKQLKSKEKDEKAFQEKLLTNMERIREDNNKAKEAKALREKLKEDRREREREEAIVMMQTVDFTPRSKAYFDGKKREALQRLSARELFPNATTTSNEYQPHMAFEDEE